MTRNSLHWLLVGSLGLVACESSGDGKAAKATPPTPSAPCAPVAQAPAASTSSKLSSIPNPISNPSPIAKSIPIPISNSTSNSTSTSTSTSTAASPPTSTSSAAAHELHVKRLLVAHEVAKREPVGAASTFTTAEAAKPIFAFVEIDNPDKAESDITVSFARDGAPEGGGVKLHVGAARRWRTWASTRSTHGAGAYRVIVRDASGREIGRASFTIGADPPAAA